MRRNVASRLVNFGADENLLACINAQNKTRIHPLDKNDQRLIGIGSHQGHTVHHALIVATEARER